MHSIYIPFSDSLVNTDSPIIIASTTKIPIATKVVPPLSANTPKKIPLTPKSASENVDPENLNFLKLALKILEGN